LGFFFVENKSTDKHLKGLSPEFLRKHECNVCPLNELKDLKHPKMGATGAKNPVVYILGEANGKNEDEQGKQFVGKSGRVLRFRIPKEWDAKIRWNNSVNCRPPNNDTPDNVALQCCRPRLERDIAASKPRAIFGFGAVPLFQITKQTGINLWRERRIPVDIAGHRCWFYPMLHPSYILHKRKFEPRDINSYGCDEEFAFALDLKRAFAEVDNLPEPLIHSVADATAGIELLTDINAIATRLNQVASDPSVGVDLETNCLRPYSDNAKILSMAFSGKKYTFAFPVDHSQAQWTKLERKQLDVLIKRFLYESSCRKVSHHLPFELEWFGHQFGTRCFYASDWHDSESQAYILDARRGSASLDFLCLQYFGLNLKEISGLDRKNLDKSPINQVLKYNAIDARYHRLLYLEQAKRIKQEGLQEVYEHQLRRIPALVLATMQGVPVDQQIVEKLKKKYKQRADQAAKAIEQEEVVKEFEEQKGRKFNPGSPQDVNYLLKTILNLEIESTEKSELAHIEHPIAEMIVQYREPMKVLGTYIESIDAVSSDTNLFPDGLLHPIISTTTVRTGRTSSDSPNIQNFPKHDEELKEVRSQVKSSDPNIVVVSFDYAGIQARNVAMESKDERLVKAFWNNYDVHADWRDRIVKKYPKWIPKQKLSDPKAMKHFRQEAKNKFVFPTFFGAQAHNTSEGLGIPKNICEELLEEFFDEFKDIKRWHTSLLKCYLERGYVTGLSRYRRYAPVSTNELINSPIQADETVIATDALIRLSEMEDPRYQVSIFVHDDLTFFWPKKEVEKRAEIVIETMVNCPFEWAKIVPIGVEMSVGPDWINLKEVGKFSSDAWNGIVEIKERM
jgi:uracil-DNA glycosylase family 4